jgi:cytochrome b6-f complex iron-sulfur subunit
MSATAIFITAVIAAGVVAVLGIFAVAARRGSSAGPVTTSELDRKAVKRDRAARKEAARAQAAAEEPGDGSGVATLERTDEDAAAVAAEPAPDPVLEREPVTPEAYGVTRRKFFNRALAAVFGLFLAQFALASLWFVWPKLKGGFGTPVNVGKVGELKSAVIQVGSVQPQFIASAQSWIVPIEISLIPGSSYESVPFVVAGGEGDGVGLMALWQRCVHLGCRVPDCVSSQGFECPCHGSKYNIHGEYEGGPAPRNMDRFGVSVSDSGDFIIETGNVVQTARSKTKTAVYPQGPFCV